MASGWVSAIGKQYSRLQIDQQLLISMFRNALPPTAAMWVIESSKLGKSFDFVGYLPVILCILQQPILPRVQFLKGLLVTCILTALSACIALLAGYCNTQARLHTTPPGRSLTEYNSSAAAVAGVWLVFAVWAIQTFRVYRPQYTTSCVIATIMAIVSIGNGARLTTTAETTDFVAEMLQMFYLGLSFSTTVNLLVLPTTSRDVVLADVRQYLSLLGKVLGSHASIIEDLDQNHGPESDRDQRVDVSTSKEKTRLDSLRPIDIPHGGSESLAGLMNSMSILHTKLRGDTAFAKNDIGWSNISASDLDTIVERLRNLVLSLRGMSALMPHFKALCEGGHHDVLNGSMDEDGKQAQTSGEKSEQELEEWRAIFLDLKEPIGHVGSLMQEGLQHVAISLGLDQKPTLMSIAACGWRPGSHKKITEIESGDIARPGDQNFVRSFEEFVDIFHRRRGSTLLKWMARNKSANGTKGKNDSDGLERATTAMGQHLSRGQEQLFVILYMQHLYHHVTDVILDLVKFADSKSIIYSSEKRHLILPGEKRLAFLFEHLASEEDTHDDFDQGMPQAASVNLETSDDDNQRAGSEHPEKSGKTLVGVFWSCLARVSNTVGSSQSFFGFRVACAVLSVVIVGLLGQTQSWFYDHRCLWATVFIPFSMSPNSGETLSILLFRMIGSTWALGLALVNWYIVDGRPAGVIVFYFIFTFFENYFVIRLPQYGSIWRPAMITRAIIVGYTLQTQHSKVPLPPATTTESYPIYLIGPYRYVCTIVGVSVAFIWTVFPRSSSARSLARNKLGNALSMLGVYYHCMHSTVGMWATGSQGDLEDPDSPGRQLRAVRDKLFAQELVTLAAIRGHIRFSRFEPTMGATFRRDLYRTITKDIDTIVSYMNMVVYAAAFLEHASDSKDTSYWQDHLAQAFRSADFNTHSISVLLSVISVSVSNNQPLPPGLSPPQPYPLTRRIEALDPEMFTVAHAEDPGYAAFAVIEIGSSMMYESVSLLLKHVQELVGVVEFSPLDKEKRRKQA